MGGDAPSLRADARRNRTRVLQAAGELFSTDGLSVPVYEIARRAGVGTGTVSRHFPTKESLFEAILAQQMTELIDHADQLADHEPAGTAFFSFFTATVHAGANDRGLAERLATAVGDREGLGERIGADVLCDRLGALLDAAQQAGAVRPGVTLADVEALMVACMSRTDSLQEITTVVTTGLRS